MLTALVAWAQTTRAGSPAAGSPVVLSEQPISIVGTLGDDATFRTQLRLTSTSPTDIFLYPSELRASPTGPLTSIPPFESLGRESSAVAVVDPSSLTLGRTPYADLTVSVSGIQEPGTYYAYLEVFYRPAIDLDGGSPTGSPTIAGLPSMYMTIKVLARDPPRIDVARGDLAATFRLTRCDGPLDCWLSHELLPPSETTSSHGVIVDNPGDAPLTVLAARADAIGDATGQQLSAYEWSPPFPVVVDSRSSRLLSFELTDSKLLPDRYRGSIYLETNGGVKLIPLDVTWRDGPFGPLVLIVGGLLVGYVAKYMSERGDKIVAASNAIASLRADLHGAALPDRDLSFLSGEISDIERRLREDGDADAASTSVRLRRAWYEILREAAILERSDRGPQLEGLVRDVRIAVYSRNVEGSAQAAQALRTASAMLAVEQPPAAAPAPGRASKAGASLAPADGATTRQPSLAGRRSTLGPLVAFGAVAVLLLVAMVGSFGLSGGGGATFTPNIGAPSAGATALPSSPPIATPLPTSPATRPPVTPRPTFALAPPAFVLPTSGPNPTPPEGPPNGRSTVRATTELLIIAVVLLALALLIGWLLARAQTTAAHQRVEATILPALRIAHIYITLVLFFGLTIVGLKALYIDQGAEFAGGVVDPLVQFLLWGLASGVASRTLGNLAPTAARAAASAG